MEGISIVLHNYDRTISEYNEELKRIDDVSRKVVAFETYVRPDFAGNFEISISDLPEHT